MLGVGHSGGDRGLAEVRGGAGVRRGGGWAPQRATAEGGVSGQPLHSRHGLLSTVATAPASAPDMVSLTACVPARLPLAPDP